MPSGNSFVSSLLRGLASLRRGRRMRLDRYFEADDGSLPEVEVHFADAAQMKVAFSYLFEHGGIDASVGGSHVWLIAEEYDRPFNGPEDVDLVVSGVAHPFHLVLQGISMSGTRVPALGVFVDPQSLTLDYRMGDHWEKAQIDAFIELLRQLRELGGRVSVPWWGADGERAFRERIDGS